MPVQSDIHRGFSAAHPKGGPKRSTCPRPDHDLPDRFASPKRKPTLITLRYAKQDQ